MVFGMVLHRECTSSGHCLAQTARIFQRPLEEALQLASQVPKQEDNTEVMRLVNKGKVLTHSGLSIVEVMAIAIKRCIQPLQSRVTPLWNYNGEDNATS